MVDTEYEGVNRELSEVLQHHGVKGQKWGVQKRPLPGGSRGKTSSRTTDTPKDTNYRFDTETSRKRSIKDRRKLTDSELSAYTKRLEAEKRFKDLAANDVAPAKKFIKSALHDAGKQALTSVAKNAMLGGVRMAVDKEFTAKDFAKGLVSPDKKTKKTQEAIKNVTDNVSKNDAAKKSSPSPNLKKSKSKSAGASKATYSTDDAKSISKELDKLEAEMAKDGWKPKGRTEY